MKTINSLFLALAALFIWSACEDDADKYYLSSLTENELIASTNNIVLTEDIAQKECSVTGMDRPDIGYQQSGFQTNQLIENKYTGCIKRRFLRNDR